jgi:rfaE bifunctional protein nucleotidyltransferase chain/domain
VVVTLDRDGTLALPGPDFVLGTAQSSGSATAEPIPEHRTWARPAGERQASGAGDTFVACLTVGFAAGLDAPVALNLAQAAADIVVHRPGTAACSTADLQQHLGGTAVSVTDVDRLAVRLQQDRLEGRRIVLTNGCFDVLHRGHTRSLEQARQLGDVLVVALNDDASVRHLKGPDRPINPIADRAAVVAALSCVDHVVVFSSETAVPLIQRLHPDVYAKGGDHTVDLLPETAAVRMYGGDVITLDFVPDQSTSAVVRRIRAADQVGRDEPESRPA